MRWLAMGVSLDELKARLDAVEATFLAGIIERDSLAEQVKLLRAAAENYNQCPLCAIRHTGPCCPFCLSCNEKRKLEARNVRLTADFHRVQSELDAAEQNQRAASRAARKLATMYHRGECSRRSELDDLIEAFDAWLPSQPGGSGG